MLYLDTSILVAALTNEDLTEKTQSWLRCVAREPLAVSEWTRVEFASALAQKVRARQIDDVSRNMATAGLVQMCEDSLAVFGVAKGDFSMAIELAHRAESGLRAGDALHLAICLQNGATMCSNDIGLLKACAVFGAPCIHAAS